MCTLGLQLPIAVAQPAGWKNMMTALRYDHDKSHVILNQCTCLSLNFVVEANTNAIELAMIDGRDTQCTGMLI